MISITMVNNNHESPIINKNKVNDFKALSLNLALIIVIMVKIGLFFQPFPIYKELFLQKLI